MPRDLIIDHIGASGDGIALEEGRTYYVPFAAPGDHLSALQGEARGQGYMAEIHEINKAGPFRVTPRCKHFGTCGGCSLQHLDDGFVADWKRQRIVDCLSMSGISNANILPTISSPAHSRRRVEFVASKRKKGVMIGYHVRRSHQVFDVGDCPLIHRSLFALIKPLRSTLPGLMPRNSSARLMATVTDNGPDILVTAENELSLETRQVLAEFATQNNLSRIAWRQNPKDVPEVISAIKPAKVQLGDIPVTLSPGGFLQATTSGEEALVEIATKALQNCDNVVDLFAGCGSFTFPLSRSSKVHAVEGDQELVSALQSSANKNILPISTETRDLFRRPLFTTELKTYDGLLFDPPRAGAKAQVEEIAESSIGTVVAVSCNPVTFARDISHLVSEGYQLEFIQPVDQFLWSAHVEMGAVLRR
ncbi:class I SAM-dependent RNA methyltransferase [Sneathiella marina]|uniref:Class I SAM-dependent RNA methyltransferase n=1 Tax=Sneathiella marina TaxID=2950108 RepID=A0ABY4W7F0_9PROT|nr:class I SAM-dependent RNA methyltransferase [Sneathiella marina]USG62729.1 class I SAM-dependent RNA methyltransferase [Sneathiella marina]